MLILTNNFCENVLLYITHKDLYPKKLHFRSREKRPVREHRLGLKELSHKTAVCSCLQTTDILEQD